LKLVRVQDVTIRANNIAELRAFYTNVGFREVLVRGADFAVFSAGDSELVVSSVDDRPIATVGIGFQVEDLDVIRDRLSRGGIAYEGPMQLRPGKVGIRLADPNGNVVEFFHDAGA
jgi:catechol 2,3-dioxygenase-like lactoylglutathione lyase family enzyme